eukprot:2880625-Amphidinium_carterae.1
MAIAMESNSKSKTTKQLNQLIQRVDGIVRRQTCQRTCNMLKLGCKLQVKLSSGRLCHMPVKKVSKNLNGASTQAKSVHDSLHSALAASSSTPQSIASLKRSSDGCQTKPHWCNLQHSQLPSDP